MNQREEYIRKYPSYHFEKCLCLIDYECNYKFLEGKEYDCICQLNTITLISKGNDIVPLKTFNIDDFFKFFKIISLSEIRESKIDIIIN